MLLTASALSTASFSGRTALAVISGTAARLAIRPVTVAVAVTVTANEVEVTVIDCVVLVER